MQHLLHRWWQSEVIEAGKGPLLLGLIAFVVTFVVTRTITRMIRAGRGPFRDLNSGGVHLHHSTPGVVLLVAGGFTSVGASGLAPWSYVAALGVGIGASLVLDEFAMIFHLEDVYWSREGQLSVNMVTLAAACIGLAVVGVSPLNVAGLPYGQRWARSVLMTLLVVHLLFVAITALKGKLPTALLGLFVAPITWVSAIRLARPRSPWARWFYSPAKKARSVRRTTRFDDRWSPIRSRWDRIVGGGPTMPPAP